MYAYFTPEYLRTMHSISRHMRCIRTLTRSLHMNVHCRTTWTFQGFGE